MSTTTAHLFTRKLGVKFSFLFEVSVWFRFYVLKRSIEEGKLLKITCFLKLNHLECFANGSNYWDNPYKSLLPEEEYQPLQHDLFVLICLLYSPDSRIVFCKRKEHTKSPRQLLLLFQRFYIVVFRRGSWSGWKRQHWLRHCELHLKPASSVAAVYCEFSWYAICGTWQV